MTTKKEISKVMSHLGSRTSEKKAAASRKNAQLGGRPKGSGGLTDLQRQAWDLREQGLSINEIGIRMDRQPENIRQLLARAQNKIGRG